MNNQECRTRTKIINISNNEPVVYLFSIKVNQCIGSCNDIDDPYAKLCVPGVVKNINIQFDAMESSNKTQNDTKVVNANADLIQVFLIINKDGMKIIVGVNVGKT